jgi:hypothetical protein
MDCSIITGMQGESLHTDRARYPAYHAGQPGHTGGSGLRLNSGVIMGLHSDRRYNGGVIEDSISTDPGEAVKGSLRVSSRRLHKGRVPGPRGTARGNLRFAAAVNHLTIVNTSRNNQNA